MKSERQPCQYSLPDVFLGKQTLSSLVPSLNPTLSCCNIYHLGSRPSRLPWLPVGAAPSAAFFSSIFSVAQKPAVAASEQRQVTSHRDPEKRAPSSASSRVPCWRDKVPPTPTPIHPVAGNQWQDCICAGGLTGCPAAGRWG